MASYTHHRKPTRIPNRDYAAPDCYMVTINAHQVGAFKSAVSRRINALRGTRGTTPWQRSFHDHAIRDALELDLYRNYIKDNPRRWGHRRKS